MTVREAIYDDLFLWAGINQEGISEDAVHGHGINTVVDLLPFEDSEVFKPLVEPPGFWDAEPDVTLPCENRTVLVPAECTIVKVR